MAKASLQKALSFLPEPQRANGWFQRHVTRSLTLSETFLQQRIEWSGMHVDSLRRHGGPTEGFSALELGSGWFPLVPLCLFLAGADAVTMADIQDLSDSDLAIQAVDGLLDAHDRDGLGALGRVEDDRVDALRDLRGVLRSADHVAALSQIGVHVRPGDVRQLEFPKPVDLICSNTVFEHLRPDDLEDVLRYFARIAGPGMVMSHLIDLCDHYAYFDPGVSIYHFLRYSDRVWAFIDNDVQPMNRLRASEYRDLYERAGVTVSEEHLRGCDPLALVGEPLAPRFKAMDPADVACNASHLVSRFDEVRPERAQTDLGASSPARS